VIEDNLPKSGLFKEEGFMSIFYILIIFSFLLIVFLFVFSHFLYQRLNLLLEQFREINIFHEETLKRIQNLTAEVSQYRQITESIQDSQRNLNESFKRLEQSFQALKVTATELQSAHQTKKAVLDLMKG